MMSTGTRHPRRRRAMVELLLVLIAAPVAAQSGAPAAAAERLVWLAGCWQGTLASGATYEDAWLAPRAGSLEGEREGQARAVDFPMRRVACPGSDPAASRDERLAQRQEDFLAALAARDAERTAAFFADDAVLQVANLPQLQGRDAIGRFYANVFRHLTASRSTTETLRVAASGDLGYATGRTTNVFAGEPGPVEFAGKFLLVWEKRAGEWQVAAYSLSSDRAEASR